MMIKNKLTPLIAINVIFLCFFDFRLSTFTHCAPAGSPSGAISSESETHGAVFSYFEGTDEDEEGHC